MENEEGGDFKGGRVGHHKSFITYIQNDLEL